MRLANPTRPAAPGRAAAPRPLSRSASALGAALSRAWSLPPQRNFVAIDRHLEVPMSDGTKLLADHYLPITSEPAATVLVRCPYGRGLPYSLLQAQLVAERGFHVLLQSCRGTFGSGGTFEPMRHEVADGQDTVAWLRNQNWFDGRLATFGASYLGFVQWALAMDPPPELVAAVVFVGPHDFSRTAYRSGAFDLYNFMSWSDLIVHQERVNRLQGMVRTATADRRLRPALDRMPVSAGARDLLGAEAPWFDTWLEHPDLTDPFWAPLQCGAALECISAPTLLVGGWQDLFIEQTLEQYRTLAARGVPVRMLVGPWTHLDTVTKAGTAFAESLAWLDRYAGRRRRTRPPATRRASGSAEPANGAISATGRPPAPGRSGGTWARTARSARARPPPEPASRPPASATTRPTPRLPWVGRSCPSAPACATTGPSSSAPTCWSSAASRWTSRSRCSARWLPNCM